MRRFWEAVKAERTWISMAIVVFLTSAILGYIKGEALHQVLKNLGVLDKLQQVAQSIHKDPTFLHIFFTIFLNNLFASLTVIVLGLLPLLGIFLPLLMVMENGLLLGMTLWIASHKTHMNLLYLLATSILPHGIFEISAVILAVAIGTRIGTAQLRILPILAKPDPWPPIKEKWLRFRQRILVELIGITVLLFIAALIETSLILYVKPLM